MRALEVLLSTPHHDGERRVLRLGDRARYRRVDHAEAVGGERPA
jgi:hypothetical protein